MRIGIPKEVKTDEYRVGAIPLNVEILVEGGHEVFVQTCAGEGSGFSDEEYIKAGAKILRSAKELYESSELIVKVKEPQPSEYELLDSKHTLFCYLHLAPIKELTDVLMQKKVCAIAYETVQIGDTLPLLAPMSEIAGKMAPVVGAYHLSRYQGGEGVLISGADGVECANVLVIGAGNAGYNAAKIAYGMGANVTVLNRSANKLEVIKKDFKNSKTAIYSKESFDSLVKEADIVISSILIHGGSKTPKLIDDDTLRQMKSGSIIVDITIDQGGISSASRPTTHTDPVFVHEGVLHYCVANMPGAYPKTATKALTNATFEYVKKIADNGALNAIKDDKAIFLGVNVYNGYVVNEAVANEQGFEYMDLEGLLL